MLSLWQLESWFQSRRGVGVCVCVCVYSAALNLYPKAFYSDLQYKLHALCGTHFGVYILCPSPSIPNRGKAPKFPSII